MSAGAAGAPEGAIGGYFGLDLRPRQAVPHASASRFQSARAAFAWLLDALKPSAVWMPRYICDSMLAPLEPANVPARFYRIDSRFRVEPGIELAPGELLLYVNYFGVCGALEGEVLQRFGPARVVLDRSQAFFAPPRESLATIYSPRKFFGVPDGGLLVSASAPGSPAEEDDGSVARCEHLLKRAAGQVEAGHAAFRRAEATLDDFAPRRMSRLTARLLESTDFEAARAARERNFRYLHERLGARNQLEIDVDSAHGPLCYPLLCYGPDMRQRLADHRIFVPSYWPEVVSRVSDGDFEARLTGRALPIPCDQRYSTGDMQAIVDVMDRAQG